MSMESAQRNAVQGRRLSVGLARNEEEVLAAQRLRYCVFREELGAQLDCGDTGFDQDMFDPYCEHVIVKDENLGEVVGTYRILTPEGARKAGGFYSETEFDLARLRAILPAAVEVGRSCVRRDFRTGPAILMLWSCVLRFVQSRGCEFLMGCASVGLQDGGHEAASLYAQFASRHLGPDQWRVIPFHPLPLNELRTDLVVRVPPLVKGYVHLGAHICGEPAWDPGFRTADFFTLLPLSRMNPRFRRQLLGA